MSASQNLPVPGGFPDQAEAETNLTSLSQISQTTEEASHLEHASSSRRLSIQADADFASNFANKPANTQHKWARPSEPTKHDAVSNFTTSSNESTNIQQNWHRASERMEEDDIARAVELSLKEQRDAEACANDVNTADSQAGASSDPPVNGTANPQETSPLKKKPRNTIQDMVDNLALRLANEFTPIADDLGDTLLYIGPPAKAKDQSSQEYTHIKKHFDRFHRIDSRRLKDLGSHKFDALLRPNACIRAEKRLTKLDAYKSVSQEVKDKIKYHIDLRPPNEGEEAVILLTDLSCTQGVRSWHLAETKYNLPPTVVRGTDQLDTKTNPYYLDAEMISLNCSADGKPRHADHYTQPDPSRVPEYSALRHHSAVERLLQAFYGNDPKLDSAPKMWTFFALAKYFDCAKNPLVSHWIAKWLSAVGNRNFIQNNPEVAYRIGMGTMDQNLVLDAFSILVGEKALMDICSEIEGMIRPSSVSVHGRQQENLDDDEQNRVSHAASSIFRRMTGIFRSVVVDLDWMCGSKEYQKLLEVKTTNSAEAAIVQEAKDKIQGFVKGRFLRIIRMVLIKQFSDLDLKSHESAPFRHGNIRSFISVYSNLAQEARPFTRTFWMALSRARFMEGHTNIQVSHINELKNRSSEHPETDGIKVISRARIDQVIWDVNTLLNNRLAESNYENALAMGICSSKASGQAPVGSGPQSTFEPLVDPVLESPKRPNTDMEELTKGAGKRRKTMDTDAEPFSLPYRPVSPFRPVDAAAIHQDSGAAQPSNVDYGTTMSTVTDSQQSQDWMTQQVDESANRESNAMFDHFTSAYPSTGPSLPPQALHSQPMENLPAPSADSSSIPQQSSGYVREYDPAYGLEVLKFKTVENASLVTPQHLNGDEKYPKPEAIPGNSNPNWQFNENTRVWSLPNPQPALADTTTDQGNMSQQQQSSYDAWHCHQPPDILAHKTTSGRRAVQQFSNSNTYSPDSPTGHRNIDKPPTQDPSINQGDGSWHGDFFCSISARKILEGLSVALSNKCEEIVYPPHLFHGNQSTPVDLLDSLLNLDEEETKFLPLWAGGFDDGTGGVFDDMDVPNLDVERGWKGGKRGIKNRRVDIGVEGSVSGSESSFEDIASEAVSTVGKASGVATDGTQTVKSLSEIGDEESESESGFMNQDDVYEAIQELRMEEIRKGKMREINGGEEDDNDDDDDSTIMGAGSDIQGEFFGDDAHDHDDEDQEEAVGSPFDYEDDDGDRKIVSKGKVKATESDDDDMDLEIIDKDDL